jgi:DNA helicase TIP49 (TBP-interacting protein)
MNKQKIISILNDTLLIKDHIDVDYCIERRSYNNEDKLKEYIQERIHEQEIVYYHKAIDFLKENDPSLRDSVELAHDIGYEINALNSELLATILLQDMLSQELYSLDFSDCFED